jgi:hypothetical protein
MRRVKLKLFPSESCQRCHAEQRSRSVHSRAPPHLSLSHKSDLGRHQTGKAPKPVSDTSNKGDDPDSSSFSCS